MSWQKTYFCTNCKRELSDNDYADGGGVCPYCGFTNESTFCRVYRAVKRWEPGESYRWWNPLTWNDGKWIYRNEPEGAIFQSKKGR